MLRTLSILMVLVMAYVSCPAGGAAESVIAAAGVRGGFEAAPKREYFHQYEAFVQFNLPWEWRWPAMGLAPQVEVAAGNLHGSGKDGFIGSFGPDLNLDFFDRKLDVKLGINLLFLGVRQYGRQDFGSNLMFGAHIGLDYLVFPGWRVGYRLQHMSLNKIFYPDNTPNPGLDMHMFSLSREF